MQKRVSQSRTFCDLRVLKAHRYCQIPIEKRFEDDLERLLLFVVTQQSASANTRKLKHLFNKVVPNKQG
jgi:hypothetical protein